MPSRHTPPDSLSAKVPPNSPRYVEVVLLGSTPLSTPGSGRSSNPECSESSNTQPSQTQAGATVHRHPPS